MNGDHDFSRAFGAGICGERSAELIVPGGENRVSICCLKAGHAGWHHAGDDHNWSPAPGAVWATEEPGAWVVYSWDMNAIVQSIHAHEVDALRVVNSQGYGKAAFVPFGMDFTEAIK